MIGPLSELLLMEKKVSFDCLINKDYNLPVDRILKFLKMLKRSLVEKQIEHKGLNVVEKVQLEEIEYAEKNLNKNNIFKAKMNKVDQLHVKQLEARFHPRTSKDISA